MFITKPEDEDIDSADNESAGRQMWQRFRQNWSWPTFHVSIARQSGVEVLQTSHVFDWINLPRVRGDDPWLVEPRLVSPGWLNGTGGWKMEVLGEVWLGQEPDRPVDVLVFFPVGRGRYVESELQTDAAMLRDLRKIYPV